MEWLYAFDIHCNGFFVSFLLTHVLQFLLLPMLLRCTNTHARTHANMCARTYTHARTRTRASKHACTNKPTHAHSCACSRTGPAHASTRTRPPTPHTPHGSDGLTATLCANTLWAIAIAAYFYVTHLGYCALPFLKNTE